MLRSHQQTGCIDNFTVAPDMLPARIARFTHRWLALAIGVQLVVWTASGVYMTAVDLDFIHGDALVHNVDVPFNVNRVRVSPGEVVRLYPGVTRVSLRALPTGADPVYEITGSAGVVLLDATTGRVRSPLSRADVESIARAYYAGSGELRQLRYIEDDPPIEFQSRPLPVWRADFADWLETSLYVDPASGRLVTQRHRFWRWFDFLWSLHIMDYRDRSDVNNALLRAVAAGAVVLAASGIWLIAYSFRWGRAGRRGRRL